MSNNEEPFDVEKENPTPVTEETPKPVSAVPDQENDGVKDEETADRFDPATTPAPTHDKRKLSTGWLITGFLLLLVVAAGIVAFVVSSVNNTNESRDAITGLNLDSMGLSVVEDSIDGNHFLVSGEDSGSGTTYYAHCELEKYDLDDTKTGLVFCENSFLTEVSLDGEN